MLALWDNIREIETQEKNSVCVQTEPSGSITDIRSGKPLAGMGTWVPRGHGWGACSICHASTKHALLLFYWWASQRIGHVPEAHITSNWQSQKLKWDLPFTLLCLLSHTKGMCRGNRSQVVVDLNRRKPRRENGWWQQEGDSVTVWAPEPKVRKKKLFLHKDSWHYILWVGWIWTHKKWFLDV